MQLVGVAVSLASGILAEQLATVITDDAAERLDGVVFAGGGRQIDPTLVTDLLTPERLLTRLQTFAWNCATGPKPLSITIDNAVTLALVAHTVGPDKHLGVSVNLAPGKTFPLASGDVKVTLEVDASWIDPVVPAGLSIFVLKGNAPDALSVDFGLAVAGIGVRFSKTAGPLVELGAIALDGIAVHLYGEATSSGLGGGVRLQLSGLAVAPGGGGSGNGMANSLVNDAGAAGANNRPTFSPSLSIQKHPGPSQGVKVGLRAGDPPGPWFVVIQRQLGPIYVERIGLNTVEQDGKVTRDLAAVLRERVAVRPLGGGRPAVAELERRRRPRHQQLVGRPDGPRRQRRHGRGVARRWPPQERRRQRCGVVRRHARGPFRDLWPVGVRWLRHRPGRACVVLRVRRGQRTDRRATRLLRHGHRRRARHQPRPGHTDRPQRFRHVPVHPGARPGRVGPGEPDGRAAAAEHLLPALPRQLLVRRRHQLQLVRPRRRHRRGRRGLRRRAGDQPARPRADGAAAPRRGARVDRARHSSPASPPARASS